jgi:hypothetical protein
MAGFSRFLVMAGLCRVLVMAGLCRVLVMAGLCRFLVMAGLCRFLVMAGLCRFLVMAGLDPAIYRGTKSAPLPGLLRPPPACPRMYRVTGLLRATLAPRSQTRRRRTISTIPVQSTPAPPQ